MRPESVSWQVQRGTRVALLCGATAALTDQQLTKMLGDKTYPEFDCACEKMHGLRWAEIAKLICDQLI